MTRNIRPRLFRFQNLYEVRTLIFTDFICLYFVAFIHTTFNGNLFSVFVHTYCCICQVWSFLFLKSLFIEVSFNFNIFVMNTGFNISHRNVFRVLKMYMNTLPMAS